RAAGALFLAVQFDQRGHLAGLEDDPVAMWVKLEAVHLSKRPIGRFNAYDDFFSIRKKEDESLTTLANRIDDGLRAVKNLRPKLFTVDDMDTEL
ncbi:hypothetical protein BV25DRAFT_1777076, partial [Artomyces pyxidatus]